ncbi:flavin reductase family protein [Nocardioides sp. zg-DK7169]|uniref:flavin reductase family protein n=1 Tax=Nocardioides sp. zg-DK7169 TaxID=2736600 RepID=UPI001C12EB71
MPSPTSRRVLDPASPDVDAYRWLTDLVVPRPIAWVSTLSAEGIGNLAPHSFFTVACARPAIVQFTSVGDKDTLRNVRATGEFVVNLVSRPLLEAANASSASYPHDVDEADELEIAVEPSECVAPPRVVASPASIECVLHSMIGLGDSTVVLGRVVRITVREDVLVEDRPAIALLEPLSRLGGSEWGLPPEPVRVRRPR